MREQCYSIFGPGSLLLLLIVWALLLVTGFALLFFGLRTPFADTMADATALARLRTDLYVSGTTLFTLGIGDVLPRSLVARALIVIESGTGLGFVALVIGYVPVLYNTFSRREVCVALLDARAGSPPTSTELLRRHAFPGGQEALVVLLVEWERWSAEILETHVSYPILCYYRSQHDNQSWLSALTAVLDSCALLISVVPGIASRQAQLTFAMARHALVDLGHVFHLEKHEATWQARDGHDRLPDNQFDRVCELMSAGQSAAVRRPRSARPPPRPPRPLRAPRPGARRLPRHASARLGSRATRQGPVEDRRGGPLPGRFHLQREGIRHQRPG